MYGQPMPATRTPVITKSKPLTLSSLGVGKLGGSGAKSISLNAAHPAPAAAPAAPAAKAPAGAQAINAPMPGTILAVNVKPGQAVKRGDVLVVLEAMKMENSIVSDYAGTVKQILVKTGDNVQTDAALIEVE